MLNYILLGSGIYLIFMSMINITRDMKSRILLKVIPMFIGLFNVFMFLVLNGYVNL